MRQRSIVSKEGGGERPPRDKGIREGDSVLLRIVARLAAVKGVLFGRQVQVRIFFPTQCGLNIINGKFSVLKREIIYKLNQNKVLFGQKNR